MSRPLVGAAMIVRDEERYLGACLKSICEVVDEIVIVDTGSQDSSVQIAQSYGARVVHHSWNDDFSEARNVSLDNVDAEWVLYIDADERLNPTSREELTVLLDLPEVLAYRLWLQPRSDATAYREYRLWRNDPRIRFEGVIHERVVPAIHRVAEQESMIVGLADLTLFHVGYEGDQTAKHYRNLPLLQRQAALDPSNLFVWNHLARVLGALGDTEQAEATLEAVVARDRSIGVHHPVASLSYLDLIRYRHRRGEAVDDLVAEARTAFPENLAIVWTEARILMDEERYVEALVVLEKMVELTACEADPGAPAYDQRLVSDLPWDSIGLCRFRLGDFLGAREAYRRAGECASQDYGYRAKEAVASARAQGLFGQRAGVSVGDHSSRSITGLDVKTKIEVCQ
ncbi:MAG: glycosyltransferase [Acidimicrobiales bacterium]